MPILVEVPGRGIVEFPDGTEPEAIEQALAQFREESPSTLQTAFQRSGLQGLGQLAFGEAGANLPVTGGAIGGLVAGPPGAVVGGALGALGQGLTRAAVGDPRTPRTPSQAFGSVVGSGAIQGGLEAVGGGVTRGLTKAGQSLFRRALKPSLTDAQRARGGAEQLVQTGLEEGITASPGGAQKIGRTLESIDEAIGQRIGGSAATVDPTKVLQSQRRTVEEFANQVAPRSDLRAIGDVGREFFRRTRGQPMAVQKAQNIKTGTQRRLKRDFGRMGSAEIEAQKGLSRGLREEIARSVPEVAPLNERAGRLIDLERVVQRPRIGNRDPISIPSAIAAASGNPGLLAATLAQSPGAMSLAGRGAFRTGQTIPPEAIANALRAGDVATGTPSDALIQALLARFEEPEP